MTIALEAQEKSSFKYGKITASDFTLPANFQDSNANAVVLSDIGNSEFVGNLQGWFSIEFSRQKRILIRNNNGFNAAEVEVYLYTSGQSTEQFNDLKGNTYNLENGNIQTTKLDPKSVFEERVNKNLIKKKFTFPGVKAGSIIEMSYGIRSDFLFNLQPWIFQGQYPTLWSEYNVAMPDFFNYVLLSQGYLPFSEQDKKERFSVYNVRERGGVGANDKAYSLSTTVHDLKWVIKDVPAMKLEKYTSTINNHLAKLEFQLSEYRFPNSPVREIMASWPKVAEDLKNREDFGIAYHKVNAWLGDDLKEMLKGAKNNEEKIRKIYAFVRDNFACTEHHGIHVSSQTTLKDVFKKKSGSVADLNLLMLAMLRYAEIPSNPVLLSLRSRGFVHPVYPLLDRFNYVIVETSSETDMYYLDASQPYLGFNQLDESLYNGTAWVINEDNANPVGFYADSLKETKVTTVLISVDAAKGFEGKYVSELGIHGSQQMREHLAKTSLQELEKSMQKSFTSNVKINNLVLDSLKSLDKKLKLNFDFDFKPDEDLLYINPLFGETIKENPFTATQRQYPIEMPHTINEVYVLNMEIPADYQIEEIPKSTRFLMDENDGMFEYLISKSSNRIQLRMKMQINRATFSQDDYEALREYFAFVIKKQSEQIVLKKIKN
jgi:transglutaminase-like putative cysteine protease